MTIELAVTEESKTLGQKAAQDLQSTIFASFRPKISPGVLESFRASAVIPHDTLAKLQQASMTPGLAEQLRSISAAMASPISESLAAKFADIGRQMAHVEAIGSDRGPMHVSAPSSWRQPSTSPPIRLLAMPQSRPRSCLSRWSNCNGSSSRYSPRWRS